ncbi:hypothetical protein [Yoonia sp. MH D7]
MKLLLLVAALMSTPYVVSALPHKDGIVSVGNREFFVGELTKSFRDDSWEFDFRFALPLKILLDNDPLLSDQSVKFFSSRVPATELVGEFPTEMGKLERLEDDPAYMADGHDIVSFGYLDEYVYPKNSPIKYSVFCVRGGFNPGELNLCDIAVAYPYASNVLLTARKYFPGKLPEISDNFEPIATRLIEIAVCLDVTDQSDAERRMRAAELLEQNSELADCKILIGS